MKDKKLSWKKANRGKFLDDGSRTYGSTANDGSYFLGVEIDEERRSLGVVLDEIADSLENKTRMFKPTWRPIIFDEIKDLRCLARELKKG